MGKFSLGRQGSFLLNDFDLTFEFILAGEDPNLGMDIENLINVDDIISINFTFKINEIESNLASDALEGSNVKYFLREKTYEKQNLTPQEAGSYTLVKFQNWYRTVIMNDMSSTFVNSQQPTNNDINDSVTGKTLTESILIAFEESLLEYSK